MAENPPLTHAEMLSALDWYRAAGVDIGVGEEPVDQFARQRDAKKSMLSDRAPAPPGTRPTLPARGQPKPEAVTAPAPPPLFVADPEEARALAAKAQTLDDLASIMADYDGCGLKLRATQLVFSDGNPQARIMLVGEAPGGEEDRIGKPFVGTAGMLLDRMLASIGLDRSAVYLANTVAWRPPGNRNPTKAEIASCQPFLHRQIELVAPAIVIGVGAIASQSLFETSVGIGRLRGQWRDLKINGHTSRAMAILHPAYLLRTPAAKHHTWRDLLSLRSEINLLDPK